MENTDESLPLAGIRVVEFCHAIAGPACTMLLGDFGAEVLKIEPPGGDNARTWGSARWGKSNEFSSQYLALNRSKSSIALNLKNPDGIEAATRIICRCDVLVENYKPGVMTKLGLGYDAMNKANPRLVYCSISGFGQTGPLSAQPGYDQVMQAYAGLLSVTGELDRPAVRIGPPAIDILAASHAVNGILLALRERDRSGRGQQVDTSLYEAALQMMTHLIVDYTGTHKLMGRTGPYFGFLAPYGNFMASDREFFLGVGNQSMWLRFCEAIGRTDLIRDSRFAANGDRTANARALYDILEPLFCEKPAQYWTKLAESLAIPHSLINDISEVVEQEQASVREAVVPIKGMENLRSSGIPIKLSRTPGAIRKSPPSLGADADQILPHFGFTGSELDRLRASGTLR